jgi:hypothetical protein
MCALVTRLSLSFPAQPILRYSTRHSDIWVETSRLSVAVSASLACSLLSLAGLRFTARLQADMRNTQKRLGKAESDLLAFNMIRKEMDHTTHQISELAERCSGAARGLMPNRN